MRTRFWTLSGIAVMLSCLLVACSPKQETIIDVGTNVWPGYEPGHIAASEGLYGQAPIRMRQFTSATEVLRAFQNDAIEVAALTLDEVLLLVQDGVDVVVILVADVSHGADVIVAKPGVDAVRALSQRRVAVENTAVGAYVLSRALQVHGVPPDSVQVVSITVDESVDAFASGRADAVVTFEPFRSKLMGAGARQIFSSQEIPDEIVDVLVTKRRTLEKHEPTLKALVKGWLAGVRFVETQPERAGQLMAPRLDLTPQEALASLEGLRLPDAATNRALLDATKPKLGPSVKRMSVVMRESGLLKSEVDVSRLFDGRLLTEGGP